MWPVSEKRLYYLSQNKLGLTARFFSGKMAVFFVKNREMSTLCILKVFYILSFYSYHMNQIPDTGISCIYCWYANLFTIQPSLPILNIGTVFLFIVIFLCYLPIQNMNKVFKSNLTNAEKILLSLINIIYHLSVIEISCSYQGINL